MDRNPHWYNLNEGRDYPLDDSASCLSDRDERLPQDLITDIRIRWPELLGKYAFLSAASSTAGAVTVTISACLTGNNAEYSHAPIAAISLAKSEIEEGRHYALQSMYPGAGGYIVFGSGIARTFTGKFSSPEQSRLTPRAARHYRSLPVQSFGKLFNATALTGLVRLSGEDPIEIVSESREVFGEEQDVIVIRLVDAATTSGGIESTVFRDFAGPCGGRPESRSCGDPQPIEFVNAVAPDCDGVLEIEFDGCAILARNLDECGAVIDCHMGLSDTCLPPFLPDAEGYLPSEQDIYVVAPPDEPEPPPDEEVSESDYVIVLGELPYFDCFKDGATNFVVREGAWDLDYETQPDEDCPEESESVGYGIAYCSEGAISAGSRNVSCWQSFDTTLLNRQVTTHIMLKSGPVGALHNGGIIINYRQHASIPSRYVHYFAQIDYDYQQLKVVRFNGTTLQTLVAVNVPGIQKDHWYRLRVRVEPKTESTVSLTVLLDDPDPPVPASAIDVQIGPYPVSHFYPDTGYFGFGTNRAWSRFSSFKLEVYPEP